MRVNAAYLVLAITLGTPLAFSADHPVIGWWASQTCKVSSAKDETESDCKISILIQNSAARNGKMWIIFDNGGGSHSLNFQVQDGVISGQENATGSLTNDTLDLTFGRFSRSHFRITTLSSATATVDWIEAHYAQDDTFYIKAEMKK